MAKYYNIDPETCSIEELEAAIVGCADTETLYASLEQGCKKFINSVYGTLGNTYYCCCNLNIAESITLQGQNLIKFSVRCVNYLVRNLWATPQMQERHRMIGLYIKEYHPDFDVDTFVANCMNVPQFEDTLQIYGDTDSGYITLQPLIDSVHIKPEEDTDFILGFNKYVLDEYMDICMEKYAKDYNCKENLEKFELEKIARSVLMLKKKKYVMDISWKEPDVHVEPLHSIVYKGVEINKGTSSVFCREKQKDFVNYLMDKINKHETLNYGQIVETLKRYKKEFSMRDPNDISENMSLSDYEKYVKDDQLPTGVVFNETLTIPAHARAAAMYNNMLNTTAKKYKSRYTYIHKGDKIKLYKILGTEGALSFAFLPNNFPKEFAPKIDVDEQFKKLILDPLNRYIESLGYPAVNMSLTYSNPLIEL